MKKQELFLNMVYDKVKTLLIVVGLVGFIVSCCLESHNYSLSKRENKQSSEIEALSSEVANLQLEVKKLDNRERILKIAEEHGLKINEEKIVSIK